MNLVFLDYDDVVNKLMFFPNEEKPRYCLPKDNMVNDYQACRWISKLCLETNSKIVVTSTWRSYDNYKDCLYNGGLDPKVEIVGKTKEFGIEKTRGSEIYDFIRNFKEPIEHIVIIDDRDDMDMYIPYLVKCKPFVGFTLMEYTQALKILGKEIKGKLELL